MTNQKRGHYVGLLNSLLKEIENPKISKERVAEIKVLTLRIARDMDNKGLKVYEGMVIEKYRADTKYPRRRVKAVIKELLNDLSL